MGEGEGKRTAFLNPKCLARHLIAADSFTHYRCFLSFFQTPTRNLISPLNRIETKQQKNMHIIYDNTGEQKEEELAMNPFIIASRNASL